MLGSDGFVGEYKRNSLGLAVVVLVPLKRL